MGRTSDGDMPEPDERERAPHYDVLCTACYDAPLFGKQGWPDQTPMA